MWLVGVVVRRYIDFLILLIPTPLVSVLFLQQHPYFFFIFKNVFHSCIYIYIHSNMYLHCIDELYYIGTYPIRSTTHST